MGTTRYQQALDYLYSFIDYETISQPHDATSYDLRRMKELLACLGNPHLKAKSVHIAGTKGKGSTAAMLASVLIASGYTTGLYTSPHLSDLRERIQVGGELISEIDLINLVEKLKPEVETVNLRDIYGQLTTFELLTALGFLYFALKKVDFQVVEAGLGGRLDATNVVRPEVCIITSISLDHTGVLGDSLTQIAAEKAGIIKLGAVVITSPQTDEVAKVIEKVCLERGAELVRVGSDVTWQEPDFEVKGQLFKVNGKLASYRLSLPLLGHYQLENAAAAVAALEALTTKDFNISRSDIISGLAKVSWPGRLQVVSRSPFVLIDGAHNPASARSLRQSIKYYFKDFNRAILVIGTSVDKDIAGIVSELCPLFDKVIVTRSRHPRAMAAPLILAEFRKHGVKPRITETVPDAVLLAQAQASPRDLICITGSLFVAGEALEQLSGVSL
ncbi:MAG: folylpolyglutamate synthase/dihydrofolate synthase family protein [Dehalococcoidales bacterium]|nr:folylpolyglutamate synthase/dihydrofolate synthase family protein [Dehalococcoidales bacterium]